MAAHQSNRKGHVLLYFIFIFQAAIEISALWGTVLGCIVVFRPINQTASMLMVPYLGWVSLASAITWWVYRNNPKQSTVEIKEIKEDKTD